MSGGIKFDTSTNRSSNLAPFDKMTKSGDGGHSGDVLDTLTIFPEIQPKKIMTLMIDDNIMINTKILKLKLEDPSFRIF
jgi:hypothetical protein